MSFRTAVGAALPVFVASPSRVLRLFFAVDDFKSASIFKKLEHALKFALKTAVGGFHSQTVEDS